MNDTIIERFIKSIGMVLGGFLLIYCLIMTTQKHPSGIVLKIILATEFVAKGLFYIALGVGLIVFLAILIDDHLTKKRKKKEDQALTEREREAYLMSLKQEIERLTRRLEESREETRKFVRAFHEEQQRRVEFEAHLKNRTAKAAVDEALGHFL